MVVFHRICAKKRSWSTNASYFTTCTITTSKKFSSLLSDVVVAIYSSVEGISLRPAYSTMALISLYIFLPMRNNFLAIILGVMVSVVYVLVFALSTYIDDPLIGVVVSIWFCLLQYLLKMIKQFSFSLLSK